MDYQFKDGKTLDYPELPEWIVDESFDDYLLRNGYKAYEQCVVGTLETHFHIQCHEHFDGNKWLVCMTIGEEIYLVYIESMNNYLEFLRHIAPIATAKMSEAM